MCRSMYSRRRCLLPSVRRAVEQRRNGVSFAESMPPHSLHSTRCFAAAALSAPALHRPQQTGRARPWGSKLRPHSLHAIESGNAGRAWRRVMMLAGASSPAPGSLPLRLPAGAGKGPRSSHCQGSLLGVGHAPALAPARAAPRALGAAPVGAVEGKVRPCAELFSALAALLARRLCHLPVGLGGALPAVRVAAPAARLKGAAAHNAFGRLWRRGAPPISGGGVRLMRPLPPAFCRGRLAGAPGPAHGGVCPAARRQNGPLLGIH